MSGGLTPCLQLRSSSQQEHVNALRNHELFIKARVLSGTLRWPLHGLRFDSLKPVKIFVSHRKNQVMIT